MKVYPPLEGPTEDEYRRAENELFPAMSIGTIWTDDQRRQINSRARELMLVRQQRRDGVH